MLNSRRINHRLICAVRMGRLKKVNQLIKSYGLSSSKAGGYFLLRHALKSRQTKIAKLLLLNGSKVDIEQSKKHSHNTPLHFAVRNGDLEIIQMILNRGADIDDANSNGRTPLYVAIHFKKIKIAELLIKHGADVNFMDSDGLKPLHIAAKIGCPQTIDFLLKYGASINCAPTSNWKTYYTPMHFAVEKGHEDIVELLLNRGADINACAEGNITPLHIAVRGKHEKVLELLLQRGAKVDSQDKDGKTVLHLAVEKGYLKIVKNLLECVNNVNMMMNSRTKEGLTLFHTAVKHKQEETAKLLISYGADINALDETGKTPIFYAIDNADLKITDLLLTGGAVVKDYPELLHIAVKTSCIEIVETLLQHDVDINAEDQYGQTALYFAASSDQDHSFHSDLAFKDFDIIKGKIAKLLLSKGANVNSQTKDGETTLHIAVRKGCVKVVEVLLEYDANVNSVGKDKTTPLHNSATVENEDICRMLLSKGANVNAKGKDQNTALHIATLKGYDNVVEVLLECGAEVDAIMKYDITPLYWAVENNDEEIVAMILEYGADIDYRGADGRTVLHTAAGEGHTRVVDILLRYGSDINITCVNNQTPLDYAKFGMDECCGERNMYVFEYERHFFNNRPSGICECQETVDVLQYHIFRMKIANLYVSEQNLQIISRCDQTIYKEDKYQTEIAKMKSEKISHSNISFYDILAKGVNSLATCLRNENIVRVLESEHFENKFPLFASMVACNFTKGMGRKKLLDQGYAISHILFNKFPELPYNCIETIFNYLNTRDFRILIDACKPSSNGNPKTKTDVDDEVITSNISQV